jgi:hypothetical protein
MPDTLLTSPRCCAGQRRKVKCSGQSNRQSIQQNLQCELCAATGVECTWKLPSPKRRGPEANHRRRANTTGQAGSSQARATGDRAQTQYRTACMECVSVKAMTWMMSELHRRLTFFALHRGNENRGVQVNDQHASSARKSSKHAPTRSRTE